jgi:hypothetical protein
MTALFEWRKAIRDSDLRCSQKCVLYVIGFFMDLDGAGAFPSQQTIANGAGLKVRHVRNVLGALEEDGWIGRQVEKRRTNYVAKIPAIHDSRPAIYNSTPAIHDTDTGTGVPTTSSTSPMISIGPQKRKKASSSSTTKGGCAPLEPRREKKGKKKSPMTINDFIAAHPEMLMNKDYV